MVMLEIFQYRYHGRHFSQTHHRKGFKSSRSACNSLPPKYITAARYVLLKLIKLTLSGLELSVQMAEKTMTMQGMCESLYQTATAMTTSIEIAEKVAEEVNEEIEGLDALSAYIEKVLARVKITLLDTVLRVESEKGDTKIELRKV